MESDFTQSQLLFTALWDGDVDQVLDLLDTGDVDVNHRDVTHDLQTFMMKLCYANLDISTTNRILTSVMELNDVDVSVQDSWGRTALMHACISNKPVIIERLLDWSEVRVDMLDFDGNSALSYAVQNCDRYTIEDLLHLPGGSKMLNVANSKGATPYDIATKGGDKAICKLMDAFLNKTICLQDRTKHRKPRNRDLANLPLTCSSPSPDRAKNVYDSPRHVMHPPVLRDLARLDLQRGAVSGKSESAPVTRRSTATDLYAEESPRPGLTLTPAKMSRSHHKREGLTQAKLLLNPQSCLPSLNSTERLDIESQTFNRQRRPSISLPDLRDMTGCLVSSGNNTPNLNKYKFSASPTTSDDDDSDTDNVFSQSLPSSRVMQLVSEAKASSRLRRPQKQLTLPEINTSFPNLTASSVNTNKMSTLARSRKYSSSDELQRIVVLQK